MNTHTARIVYPSPRRLPSLTHQDPLTITERAPSLSHTRILSPTPSGLPTLTHTRISRPSSSPRLSPLSGSSGFPLQHHPGGCLLSHTRIPAPSPSQRLPSLYVTPRSGLPLYHPGGYRLSHTKVRLPSSQTPTSLTQKDFPCNRFSITRVLHRPEFGGHLLPQPGGSTHLLLCP